MRGLPQARTQEGGRRVQAPRVRYLELQPLEVVDQFCIVPSPLHQLPVGPLLTDLSIFQQNDFVTGLQELPRQESRPL